MPRLPPCSPQSDYWGAEQCGHQREYLEELGAEEDGRAVERRPRHAVVPQEVREAQVEGRLAEVAPPAGVAPLEHAAKCHVSTAKLASALGSALLQAVLDVVSAVRAEVRAQVRELHPHERGQEQLAEAGEPANKREGHDLARGEASACLDQRKSGSWTTYKTKKLLFHIRISVPMEILLLSGT